MTNNRKINLALIEGIFSHFKKVCQIFHLGFMQHFEDEEILVIETKQSQTLVTLFTI